AGGQGLRAAAPGLSAIVRPRGRPEDAREATPGRLPVPPSHRIRRFAAADADRQGRPRLASAPRGFAAGRDMLIQYEQPRPQVALIRLNRPEKMNAFSIPLEHELLSGIRREWEDEGELVVIIASARSA